jgi:NADH-quinone oxidoreductase subunit J
MTADVFLFWFLAIVTVLSALSVVLMTNPIYSALCLVMTMVSVAAIFVTLQAYFLAGVQLIVYAGAVMVLFVMVLMLFDLKNELQAFTRGKFSGSIKIAAIGALAGLLAGAMFAVNIAVKPAAEQAGGNVVNANEAAISPLAEELFLKNVFGFEVLGVLLLVIAVGTVALSRSKGGTHVKH